MDYQSSPSQQAQQQQPSHSSPQRVWAPQLLSTANQSPFPSPTSSNTYYFPPQSSRTSPAAASPTHEPHPNSANLSLNMSSLAVTSPSPHSPIGPLSHSGPFQEHAHHAHPHSIPQHPHHTHSHSHSSGSALSVSPITPVSPPNYSPVHLSTQPTFTFNFEDTSGGGGLSPTPDPILQRRPSTGSHSTSSSELAVEKSVPRKRSLTSAIPASHTPLGGHALHSHSHSHSYSTASSGAQGYTHGHGHSLPHPIITTTASSPPPPPSPTSPSSSHASHSISLSHSHSHSSLSQQALSQSTSHASFPSQSQFDVNSHPSTQYDELDGPSPFMVEDGSDDEYGTAFAGGSVGPSKPGANQNATQGVMGKPITTNNFVTKLYQMINDQKSQHFISWTEHGTSFVVSNVGEFSRNILGSHFKHNNFSSFVRQLNMYGFHKINRVSFPIFDHVPLLVFFSCLI
ncbi:HSF-type DNA-binding-domain-containing protein [Scleroderma yunnanense]